MGTSKLTSDAKGPIQARFTLVDHHGRTVTEQTYRGKRMLVYFGFTHCKMVCPRALTRLSSALQRLGSAVAAVEPLYISVDPERDTPEVMKSYLHQDYPRFTGLTGSTAQVDAARAAFRVFVRKAADPDDPDGYLMPHSAFTYLLDFDGCYLAHFTDAVPEDELVHRLRGILSTPKPP